MTTPAPSKSRRRQRFSPLAESLLIIGTVTTLATLIYTVFSSGVTASQEAQLLRHVAILNTSASMYRISGGTIDPTRSSMEIFSELQVAAADTDHTLRLSGSIIDPHLEAFPLDEDEIEDTSIPRVTWQAVAQRFAITYKPVDGIKHFELGDGRSDRSIAN